MSQKNLWYIQSTERSESLSKIKEREVVVISGGQTHRHKKCWGFYYKMEATGGLLAEEEHVLKRSLWLLY